VKPARPLYDMAQVTQQTLGRPAVRGFGPLLPMERLGLGAFGMLHNPAATVASEAGGNLLAT